MTEHKPESWRDQFRHLRDVAGLPPPTEEEFQQEQRFRDLVAQSREMATSHIEPLTRLLAGEGWTAEQRDALKARPMESRRSDRFHLGLIEYCRFAISPCTRWPSDLVRIFGSEVLRHPFVLQAVIVLSDIARDPRTAKNRIRPEVLGAAVLKRWTQKQVDRFLADEYEPKGLRDVAADELRRLHRALAARTGPSVPRVLRPVRTLWRFQALRDEGRSEKEAVSQIAKETNRSSAAVQSDVRQGRKQLGIRMHPKRSRRVRFREEEKGLAGILRALALADELKS